MTCRILGLAAAALLYGSFWPGANPALADGLDAAERAELEALRTGDMEKLVFHDEPYAPIEDSWMDRHGNPVSMADYAGQIVVANFWATWCPPCLSEMPSLDRLAGRTEGEGIAVVPISIDRDVTLIEDFYDRVGIENLQIHHDRGRDVSRRAGVLGLPVTAIMDREGRELARMVGDAEWDSPEAVALLERIVQMTASAGAEDAADAAPEG